MTERQRWYREVYLKSAHWKSFRKIALASHGRMCAKCCSFKRLQVHHLTYERLGRELISDVQVLCFDCHKKEHKPVRKTTKKTIRRKRL